MLLAAPAAAKDFDEDQQANNSFEADERLRGVSEAHSTAVIASDPGPRDESRTLGGHAQEFESR